MHNLQAEPVCVLSISEKVNGMGKLADGCETLTQSSTLPALSDIFTDVCSNPTTTSEGGQAKHKIIALIDRVIALVHIFNCSYQ